MQLATPMANTWMERDGNIAREMVPEAASNARSERERTGRHDRTALPRGVDTAPIPIIAFSKDWTGDHTSNHHVLRELAKSRRVVWLNCITTRAPKLSDARDLGAIRKKLVEVARGPVRVENDLWVATPLVLPMPRRNMARALDRWLVEGFIRAVRSRLGIDRFQLWSFLPNVADYLGMGESLAVYYCVDEWSMFEYLDREATAHAERELLGRVDAVFAVNHALADAKREMCPTTYVVPHGVDHDLFSSALDPATKIPAELAALHGPRIGFIGSLREWVDLELIAHVARARPEWSIVLVGRQAIDVSLLAGLRNVHLIEPRPHAELPGYLAGFDVGIIPYRQHTRMSYVNPLKLREYLAAGLPVVSTPLAEVERYPELCEVARDKTAFVAAIDRVMRRDSRAARIARSGAMRDETWKARVDMVARRIDELVERGGR